MRGKHTAAARRLSDDADHIRTARYRHVGCEVGRIRDRGRYGVNRRAADRRAGMPRHRGARGTAGDRHQLVQVVELARRGGARRDFRQPIARRIVMVSVAGRAPAALHRIGQLVGIVVAQRIHHRRAAVGLLRPRRDGAHQIVGVVELGKLRAALQILDLLQTLITVARAAGRGIIGPDLLRLFVDRGNANFG